jgi:hypothetical protein
MNERYDRWCPTPEQFDRYIRREVEMARANLALPGVSALSTLHSPETVARAKS